MTFNVDRFQIVDHIGSGGNAAVVRGFLDKKSPRELVLKLLDPREVNANEVEQDFRKFEHPNLLRIEELLNLNDLDLTQVPDWYRDILNCEPKNFVKHPISSCSPHPADWRRMSTHRSILAHLGVSQRTNNKTLAEFNLSDFFILVMEYCPMSLAEYVSRQSLPTQEVLRILTQVCAGLTVMHNTGISHSDLTVENILVTSDGVAKIADFGLSKPLKEGIREDIVSLGLLAFELATRKYLLQYDLMDEDEDIGCSNVQTSFVAICKDAVRDSTSTFGTVDDFLKALNKTA